MTDAFDPLTEDELAAEVSQTSQLSQGHQGHWRPVLPVPTDAAQPTKALLSRFAPDAYSLAGGWRYHDAAGRLLGFVIRYDRRANGAPASKEVKPLTFCEGPDGRRDWRCKGFPEPRPLYGLDRLAARPSAPVVVVEGEKVADAAERRFPDHVAVTSPGGSNAARKADWTPLAGRYVTIWPDADTPGARYADEVAEALRAAGAASVRTVEIPTAFPTGWDLADAMPDGVSDDDLARMLTKAESAPADGPLPLFPPLPPAEPYPVQALGPVLSRAAQAIANKVQVPPAIAAQSVLAAAALAAQAHADVLLPYGQPRPLSLFLVTVAASGDRKSTADNEALWPIRRREKALKEQHESAMREWRIASAAWAAEKRRIETNKGLDYDARKKALFELGDEPQQPLHPFLTLPDPTIEGLVKAWVAAPASLGLFTAEGGQFVGGHGMSADNRLKTASMFSEIWDGRPIKRVRAMDGVTILSGRRLSMHLLVQQDVAAQFLADPQLRDQGLLSRVLAAAPESIAGTRLYRDTAPEDEEAIRAYGARLLSILEAPWPLVAGTVNELEPRVLAITPEAEAAWRQFFDHVEVQCGARNELGPIQDFAAKAAEHAARIAGVLTIVEDRHTAEIGFDAMENALTLADWYVSEALRLQRAARTDPKLLRAQQLLEWLQARDGGECGFRDIVQLGPGPLRTKSAADEALGTLLAHGWVIETSKRPRRLRLVGREGS